MIGEEPKFYSSEFLRNREGGIPEKYLLEGASDEDKAEYETYYNMPYKALDYKKQHPEIRNPYCRWDGEIVEMEMKDTVDTLDFELYDPVAAGEEWVDAIPDCPEKESYVRLTTQILVNGRDLNDHFGQMDKLGHTQADWLYMGLYELTEEIIQQEGSEFQLACCRGCGEPGCDYVGAAFWRDGDYVIWDCWYAFGDRTRKVFRFRYEDYMEALEKLGGFLAEKERKRLQGHAGSLASDKKLKKE